MDMRILIIQAWILVMALALDAFACAFGYGAGKIKIPFKSNVLINIITSILLAVGLFFGTVIGHFLPETSAEWAAFGILFALGFYKLFDIAIKKSIRKHNGINKNVAFSLFNLNFLLNIYANP
jgi:putative sporulation protein YtaF